MWVLTPFFKSTTFHSNHPNLGAWGSLGLAGTKRKYSRNASFLEWYFYCVPVGDTCLSGSRYDMKFEVTWNKTAIRKYVFNTLMVSYQDSLDYSVSFTIWITWRHAMGYCLSQLFWRQWVVLTITTVILRHHEKLRQLDVHKNDLLFCNSVCLISQLINADGARGPILLTSCRWYICQNISGPFIIHHLHKQRKMFKHHFNSAY